MPITKSAKKALRQTKTRTKRNAILKEKIKKITRKMEDLVKESKIDEAKKILSEAYKIIDKAAKKNIIKKSNADRKKSKLSRFTKKVSDKTKAGKTTKKKAK